MEINILLNEGNVENNVELRVSIRKIKQRFLYHTSILGLRLLGSVSDVTVVLGRLEKSQVFTGCIGSDG